jgi:hypothetical protein
MNLTFIAALALALIVNLAPRSEAETSAKTAATQQQPPTPTAVVHEGDATASNDQPPKWYKAPEWVLVIVGLITAFVMAIL